MNKKYNTKREKDFATANAVAKYQKDKTKLYSIRYLRNRDAEVIAKLDSVESKAEYIKKLILDDLKREA